MKKFVGNRAQRKVRKELLDHTTWREGGGGDKPGGA